MFKALLKKQFMELFQFYFTNKKTGKKRTRGAAAGMFILFGFLLLVVAFAFSGIAWLMGESFLPAGLDWLYFALFDLLAILLGVFGSIFSTYSSLYLAKDNELLLSMPIPPGYILLVRMAGVAFTSLLYSAIVWVPAVVVYWILKPPAFIEVLFSVILTFVITVFVTSIACILGWVVAKIAVRLKSKTFVAVLLSLLIMGIYYVGYFRMQEIIQSVIANSGQIGDTIRTWVYPVYQFGMAASGDVLSLLMILLITGVIFAVVYLVLSKSFLKIATTSRGEAKKEYREKAIVQFGTKQALLRKELRHFTSSYAYMLNCGLSVILMPALTIIAGINRAALRNVLDSILKPAGFSGLVPALLIVCFGLLCSMDCITAPSISLEGQSLWILQSLPINPGDILNAKVKLAVIINGIPGVLCTVILALLLEISIPAALLAGACVLAGVWLAATFGLIMNLLRPNLTWKNETVAVKQSMAVFLTMLLGWASAVVMGGICVPLSLFMGPVLYLAIITLLQVGIVLLLTRWLNRKGTKIFESL